MEQWLQRLLAFLKAGEKDTLIKQLASRENTVARDAAHRLQKYGWLSDGSLEYANLRFADLHFADLNHAMLRHADLRHANLWDCNLQWANLEGAQLIQCDLEQANLRFADLRGARLWGAQLHNAILPNGKRWTPETDMRFFTNPASNYYGEPPAFGRSTTWHYPKKDKPNP